MLETTHIWQVVRGSAAGLAAWAVTGCVPPGPVAIVQPAAVATTPATAVDDKALAEEARALLAQAETDIQRARAKRALWLSAWESLLAARSEAQANDNAAAARSARHASEFAQLGLEQLAYPAVK